jgi:hypothetical protein
MHSAIKFSKNMACDMNEEIEYIAQLAHKLSPHRRIELFRNFLPSGYRMTTLSSVGDELRESNLLAKICIGTLITLYDDLADHPGLRDSKLLEDLYQIPFGRKNMCKSRRHPMYVALTHLWNIVFDHITTFPQYDLLRTAFEFDVMQFFNANRYAEMITDAPFLFSSRESRNYLHHNMGIVIVGTIDLMCSPLMDINSIGSARALFLEAQKAARIMNMITTVDREIKEGDVTNELVFAERRIEATTALQREMSEIFKNIRSQNLTSFSIPEYVRGMKDLFELHKSLRGVI